MKTAIKNQTLRTLARLIDQSREQILLANQKDLALCGDIDPALLDRLKVDNTKIDAMIAAVEDVIRLPDPAYVLLSEHQRDDGLLVENKSVPFGRILIIYESRPDVTIEAAITAFKAGNQILLKGGKEALYSNQQLVDLWQWALADNGIASDFVQYLQMNREQTRDMIRDNSHDIDLIIPRGGDQLIEFVQKNTSVPALISGRGNNFLYIDKHCDFQMALQIALDGKRRLSVCNALDKILINAELPDLEAEIAGLVSALQQMGIEVYADQQIAAFNHSVSTMPHEVMWSEEFLDAKILLGMVSDGEQAVNMINKYSGGHSAVIVSNDAKCARQFLRSVDCAAVYHNASTRFTDGGQFGVGAEIAISTQKLHFRGPVGLGELVTNKWFISGQGQVRG